MRYKHSSLIVLMILASLLLGLPMVPSIAQERTSQVDLSVDSSDNTNFSQTSSSLSAPSDAADHSTFLTNLEMAEKTARYIYSQRVVDGHGITWQNEEGHYLTTYSDGAAGIGDYFLNLYDLTNNETYLDWANQVGTWFVELSSSYGAPGKYPVYKGESSPFNYTGIIAGSAGIGKFLAHLASITKNTTIEGLARDIADNLISSAQVSVYGTGIRIKDKDYASYTTVNTLPEAPTFDPLSWKFIYGTNSSGSFDDLTDDTTWTNFQSNDSSDIYEDNDALVTSEIKIASIYDTSRDGESFYQSFEFDHYPIYVDPTEGIKVKLYTTVQGGDGYLVLNVYEADQYGLPTGIRIGDESNSWNASYVPTDTNGAWVNFNWTSKTAPVLNGSSPYGYVFVVDYINNGVYNSSQSFMIKTTSDNTYTKGRLTLIKGSPSTPIGEDVCFNVTSLSTMSSLDFEVYLNSTSFGVPEGYDLSDIINLTVKAYLKTNISTGLAALEIYNWALGNWEVLSYFSSTVATISETYYQTAVRDYVDRGPYHSIKLRVVAGDSANPIAVQINTLNISMYFSGEKYPYSWSYGDAGIGDYLLDCYEFFSDTSYLENATLLANYLLEEASVYSSGTGILTSWEFNGEKSLDILNGMAGIGKFLLRLSSFTDSNTSYVAYAEGAARFILSAGISTYVYNSQLEEKSGIIWDQGQYQVYYTGQMEGIAGIGDFILDVLEKTKPSSDNIDLYSGVIKIANTLTSIYIGSTKTTTGPNNYILGESSHYTMVQNGTEISITYADGSAGIMAFLSRLQRINYNTEYSETIGSIMDYFESNAIPVSSNMAYWNYSLSDTSYSKYGLFHGIAGIGNCLIDVSIRAKDALNYAEYLTQKLTDNAVTIDFDNSKIYFEGKNNSADLGVAGAGQGYLELYLATQNNTYYKYAKLCADMLLDSSNWQHGAEEAINFSGIAKGLAGIGMFLVNFYKATGDEIYINASIDIGVALVNWQDVSGKWPYSQYESTKFYTSYYEGAAGIVDYLLSLYYQTLNTTFLDSAELGLRWLISLQQGDGYWCELEGQTAPADSYLGYYRGTAGIADVFAKAYDITKNQTYLNVANTATDYLLNFVKTHTYFLQKPTNTLYYIGLEYGYAGYWKLLLHMLDIDPTNVNLYGNLTSSITFVMNLASGTGNQRWWQEYYDAVSPTSNPISLNYLSGISGLIDVLKDTISYLDQSSSTSLSSTVQDQISRAKNYIIFQSDSAFGNFLGGYYEGYHGLAAVLSRIPDLDKPTVSQYSPTTSPSLEYDDNLVVRVSATDLGSNIDSVILRYSLGDSTTFNDIVADEVNASEYEAILPAQTYNTSVKFFIVVQDTSKLSTIILDNGDYFSYIVQDNQAPTYENLRFSGFDANGNEVGSSISYGPNGGGYIRVNIYEPYTASGISSIRLSYQSGNISISSVSLIETPNAVDEYYYRIPAEYGNNYFIGGENFTYSLQITDKAGNVNVTSGTIVIGDFVVPKFLGILQRPDSLTIKSGERIPLKINITDFSNEGGSGIQKVEIRYSNDRNLPVDEWSSVEMTFVQSGIYAGEIPKQSKGLFDRESVYLYYYFVITDNAGNEVAYGNWNDIGEFNPTNADEIPSILFYNEITADWVTPTIVIGVIVGAAVIFFAVTRFRGSYLDRVRGSAKTTATFITIKEKFLGVYYKIAETLNRIGDNLSRKYREATIGERIKDWMDDHIESPAVVFLKGLLGLIVLYLKFLVFLFISPFYLAWKIITKANTKQLLLSAFIGVLLIVSSVAKYFGEDFYPIRAMFFIDFGFVLFIGSFIIIILHLIYELAAK